MLIMWLNKVNRKREMYNMNEIECYENLANAIIVRAVEDYKEAKMSNPKSEKKKIEKEKIMYDVIPFIKSDYFELLTSVDRSVILAELDK